MITTETIIIVKLCQYNGVNAFICKFLVDQIRDVALTLMN